MISHTKLLQYIYNETVKANRGDRIKVLEKENELLRGDTERLWEKIRGLEEYLGIEMVKNIKYKKK